VEWAHDRIRVLNVAPGYIETDLNRQAMQGPLKAFLETRVPVGRPGTADEVARLVASLFAEDIAYLTGETLYLDGGQGMAH
jgi:NAD(P)-dependent dehydrogenase (short-subunit alcohol dehydrogenase family)